MYLFRQQLSFQNSVKWLFSFVLLIAVTTLGTAQEKKSAASLYNEGLAKLKEKDYEAGYPLIEEALKAAEVDNNEKVATLARKNGAKAAYNLGGAKRKAKAYDEAMTLFDRGIELNPDYASNYMGRAQALDDKGEKVEAVKAYLTAAGKTTKEARAAQLVKKAGSIIGKLYSGKKYDDAIAAGKAHLESQENATVHYYMAKSFDKKKDAANAETHINKAVELAENGGKTAPDKYYWAQGNILEATKKASAATAAYKKITGEKYKANADYRIKELGGK